MRFLDLESQCVRILFAEAPLESLFHGMQFLEVHQALYSNLILSPLLFQFGLQALRTVTY